MFSGNVGTALVVVVFVLAGAATPALAAGQMAPPSDAANGSAVADNGTVTPPAGVSNATNNSSGGGLLGGLGGFADWFGGVANALSNPMSAFQDYAENVVELLVERPVPTRNGSPAWFQQPDGAVMGTVWSVTWTMVLPISIILTALHAGVAAGLRGVIPPSIVPNRKANGEVWSAIGKLFHVILGWTLMVAWLIICRTVALYFAPEGVQILPGGRSIVEQVVAGGFAGILLWLSSGVLALLAIIVWVMGWAGALLAPVMYPASVAAEPPDLPVVRNFKMLPSEGTLLSLVAVPVPTAFILGIGYPIINSFRDATSGAIASLGGVPLTTAMTLGMWFAALVAPILMVANSRQMRPMAMFAAGALGAASAMSVRDKMGKTPDVNLGGAGGSAANLNGGGATVDPLQGSPFQRSTDGGQFGGGLGAAGDGDAGASALGGGSGGGSAAGGFGAAPAPSADGGSSGAGSPGVSSGDTGGMSATGATADSGSTSSVGTAADAGAGSASEEFGVSSADELPRDQNYEIGYFRGDEWQPIEDTTFDREFVLGEGYSRIDNVYDGRDLMARGAQDAETYDVREVAEMDTNNE